MKISSLTIAVCLLALPTAVLARQKVEYDNASFKGGLFESEDPTGPIAAKADAVGIDKIERLQEPTTTDAPLSIEAIVRMFAYSNPDYDRDRAIASVRRFFSDKLPKSNDDGAMLLEAARLLIDGLHSPRDIESAEFLLNRARNFTRSPFVEAEIQNLRHTLALERINSPDLKIRKEAIYVLVGEDNAAAAAQDISRTGGLVKLDSIPPGGLRSSLPDGLIRTYDYPIRAFLQERTGVVETTAVVGPEGRIVSMSVTRSAHPLFDEATVKAMKRRARFSFPDYPGRYVRVPMPPVEWRIHQGDAPPAIGQEMVDGKIVVWGWAEPRPMIDIPPHGWPDTDYVLGKKPTKKSAKKPARKH